MGDAGIYYLSALIGFNIINFSNQKLIFSEEIFLVMILPGLDMLRLFIIRIFQKKDPFSPDQNHIHHLILKKTKSSFKTLLLILTIYFIPILVRMLLDLNTFILIAIQIIIYLFVINHFKGLHLKKVNNKINYRNK